MVTGDGSGSFSWSALTGQREGSRAGWGTLRRGWEVKLSSAVIDFDSITS